MTDIPRGTKRITLINYLLAPPHWPVANTAAGIVQAHVQFASDNTDSRLDDELSVATIEFTQTPQWLQITSLDPTGFPKKTIHGTLWRGVDRAARDASGRTEFFRAAMADDLLYAEALAEFHTTDVNAQDVHGRTALHWASEMGLASIVLLCLSVPSCDVGLRDKDNNTAFDLAQQRSDEQIANLFYRSIFELEHIDAQAALLRILTVSSSASNRPGFPGAAMFAPAQAGNAPLVQALIARGVDLSATNAEGKTALHVAAAQVGNAHVVRKLLQAGADIHAIDPRGRCALQDAADAETAAALRRWEGSLAGRRSVDGYSPVGSAASSDREARDGKIGLPANDGEFVDERGWTALHRAVFTGDKTTLLHLIDRGVDLEVAALNGETGLHFAARAGNIEILTTLLSQGADLEATNKLSYTPLHLAAWNGHTAAVILLLDHTADIEAAIIGGETALHLAAGARRYETLAVLLDRGANTEARDLRSWTALHLCASEGRAEGVTILLARGANVDATRSQNWTALHLAAANGHTGVVTVLLAHGANMEAMAEGRETPLHVAVWYRQVLAVEMLLGCGASIEAQSDVGTPLQMARTRGYADVVTVLVTSGARNKAGARLRYALGRTFSLED